MGCTQFSNERNNKPNWWDYKNASDWGKKKLVKISRYLIWLMGCCYAHTLACYGIFSVWFERKKKENIYIYIYERENLLRTQPDTVWKMKYTYVYMHIYMNAASYGSCVCVLNQHSIDKGIVFGVPCPALHLRCSSLKCGDAREFDSWLEFVNTTPRYLISYNVRQRSSNSRTNDCRKCVWIDPNYLSRIWWIANFDAHLASYFKIIA